MSRVAALLAICLVSALTACGGRPDVLTFSGSAVGAEGVLLRRQIDRFAASHGLTVEIQPTPDAADQRHQLYVQWLNAWAANPDVLQLDIVWTPEFAAAGWIRPLDRFQTAVGDSNGFDDFFRTPIAASTWNGRLYALPWFVDVGMLYWRTDLLAAPPATFDDLVAASRRAIDSGAVREGLVWQGARYEGLVTVFLEHLSGFGGRVLDDDGRVVVDSPAAVRALTFMRRSIADLHVVPTAVLAWQEEQVRFAFQNGDALFMRNWPYAAALLERSDQSAVAGRFSVGLIPHDGGASAGALGGSALAINARSRQPDASWQLVQYLVEPEQMIERARVAGEFPSRRSLYDGTSLAQLPIPPTEARRLIEHAVARPTTPVYMQLSSILQIHLHRALTNQEEPGAALSRAADEMRNALSRAGLGRGSP